MKTIGIIGGLSWHSTISYYRAINQLINERLGGSHSAKILMYSIDFDEFKSLQEKGEWTKVEEMFSRIALNLQSAGADCIVIATNAAHVVADEVRKQLEIPLLHIAEAAAQQIGIEGFSKVGLIGTKFVMERAYFTDRLLAEDIQFVIPESVDREYIHQTIFSELTIGIFTEATKKEYLRIIDLLKAEGAEAIVFACTELSMLIDPSELDIPVIDTTVVHTGAAVDFALKG